VRSSRSRSSRHGMVSMACACHSRRRSSTAPVFRSGVRPACR
jgi:hypothetical protein